MKKLTLRDHLALRRKNDVAYDVQKTRISAGNRLRQFPSEAQPDIKLEELEIQLFQEVEGLLSYYPIYTEWMSHVKGMGPRLSASLISNIMVKFEQISPKTYSAMNKAFTDVETLGQWENYTREQWVYGLKSAKKENGKMTTVYLIPCIRGIQAFPTVSKLWAWMGLHTKNGKMPKRVKGEHANWSSKMRTLSWKIGRQFIKAPRGIYGQIYKMKRLDYLKKLTRFKMEILDGKEKITVIESICPDYENCKNRMEKDPPCQWHCTQMAAKYAVKKFISHMWEKWRIMEGLPVRPPYIIEHGENHSHWDHPVVEGSLKTVSSYDESEEFDEEIDSELFDSEVEE